MCKELYQGLLRVLKEGMSKRGIYVNKVLSNKSSKAMAPDVRAEMYLRVILNETPVRFLSTAAIKCFYGGIEQDLCEGFKEYKKDIFKLKNLPNNSPKLNTLIEYLVGLDEQRRISVDEMLKEYASYVEKKSVKVNHSKKNFFEKKNLRYAAEFDLFLENICMMNEERKSKLQNKSLKKFNKCGAYSS